MSHIENKNQEHDHPLQYKWSLWHGQSWENLQMVASFQTVEGFWRLFNNLKPPSQFEGDGNYQLFKGKVEPKWEDRYNQKGGSWRFKLGDLKPNELNHAWYHCILALIGENFDYSEDICGLYLMMRKKKGYLELWIKDATNIDRVKLLGDQFKKFCLPRNKGRVTLEFTKHSDAKEGKKTITLQL
jgi:translation initiation factor 4E